MALALGAALDANGQSTANASPWTTASFAPTAGALVIAIVNVDVSTTIPTGITITGGGVTTWTEETSFATNWLTTATPLRRCAVFRAQQTSYGSAATASIAIVGGSGPTGAEWSIFQFTGVIDDSANNGAACIINKHVNSPDTNNASGTVTLSAATAADNRPVSCFFHNANEVSSPQTNWTEIGDASHSAPVQAVESQWRSDVFDTAAAASWSTSGKWVGIAFELVAASPGRFVAQIGWHPQNIMRGPHAGPPLLLVQAFPSYAGGTVATTVNVDTPGALTWTGQTVGLLNALAPVAGTVTWTGQAVALAVSIAPVAGAVTWSGQTVGLVTKLTPVAGSSTWSGATDIVLQTTSSTVINVSTSGAIVWTGQAVGLTVGLSVGAGAVTWTGQAVPLSFSIAAVAGTVTWSGQTVGLVMQLTPVAGASTWNGATDIVLQTTGSTVVNVSTPGAVTWTGATLGLKTSLAALAGAVTWSGQAVTVGAPATGWAEIGSNVSTADARAQAATGERGPQSNAAEMASQSSAGERSSQAGSAEVDS